ncbi:PREDICTED: glutathione S-transferase Mu 1-like [Priapulus caudatus]|uniref:glutathione transferase n=1 Tax=Priapulus caudatus TaxID=37621 RepID=A0ABM1DRI1_PRICU|nr:PREDICTED: glutathione S-transferase Mu 1-like [Priapulus caudatus]
MAPVLGYWYFRELAQPNRLLLAYTETEFEDKMYDCGPGPKFDRSCWTDVKPTLGLPFPNLPYYVDGDLKLTQSNTIIRYLGRKHGLAAKTEAEQIREDILVDQSFDIRMGFAMTCYAFGKTYEEFERMKEGYLKELPSKLGAFAEFLGDKKWFTGKNLNFVDFIIYELLDVHVELEPTCLDELKTLQAFKLRFEALPTIKKYMASDEVHKGSPQRQDGEVWQPVDLWEITNSNFDKLWIITHRPESVTFIATILNGLRDKRSELSLERLFKWKIILIFIFIFIFA